ncbi:MAG: nuclear transport factor 2 family protein [Ilumatobacteraceae bacterium]
MTETMPTEPRHTDLTEADRDAILASACDYIESWLDGDADRMAGCLHPGLAKRAVYFKDGEPVIDETTRDDMVTATAAGHGRKYQRPYEATILDAFKDIATVRVLSSAYMDYLHIARFEDRWLLVNVLWQPLS